MIFFFAAGGSSEEGLDMLDHLLRRPVGLAHYLFNHLAVGVDQIALGDLNRAIPGFYFDRRISRSHIGNVKAGKKILIRFRIFVFTHTEDYQSLRPECALQQIERWNFLHTGRAPGGPEVEDEKLAAELARGNSPAVIGCDTEIGGLVARLDNVVVQR